MNSRPSSPKPSLAAPLLVVSLVLSLGCASRARVTDRMFQPTLGSAQAIDTTSGLAVLPLTAGRAAAAPAWFVVTESSDSADAARRKVNWAPNLARLRGTALVQRGTWEGARLVVAAGVDFSPVRRVRADPDSAFPPREAVPGSRAGDGYSPFVEFTDGIVLNAPVIANRTDAVDRVVQIDRGLLFAVFRVSRGYARGRTAWYISTEASDPMVAAMEGATFVPSLGGLSAAAGDAAFASVRLGIVAIVNGPLASETPAQQHGLRSALRGEGDPQNILEEHPGTPNYTPVWDLHMAVWSPRAVREEGRERLLSFDEVAARVRSGFLVPMGGAVAHSALEGLAAVGAVVNCPVVAVFGPVREGSRPVRITGSLHPTRPRHQR